MEEETLVPLLERSVRRSFDLPAFSDFPGAPITYGEVAARVARLHAAFRELGVKPGSKVALLGRNSSGWATAWIAIVSFGAVAVPILPDFRAEDVHHILNHSDAVLLLTTPSFFDALDAEKAPGVRAVLSTRDLSVLHARREGLASALRKADEAARAHPPAGPEDVSWARPKPEDLASIVYTSGTTGFSKGVMLPHRSLHRNVLFAQKHMPLEAGDAIVSFLPLAHAFGCAFEFLFPVSVGCRIAFLTKTPSPKIIMQAFGEIKPALILSVPLVIEKIYKAQIIPAMRKPAIRILKNVPGLNTIIYKKIHAKLYNVFGGNFKELVIGGAAFNAEAERFFRKIKFPFTVGYGMTECGPLISYASWDTTVLGASGRIVDELIVKIDNPDPKTCIGEIMVKGSHVMQGYYKNEEATKQVLEPDGWLHTGDLGEVDENGYFKVTGRIKDMIIRGGENMYPREIEEFLYRHPDIQDVAVFGVPDRRFGEQVAAWVKLKPGASASAEEIKAFCQGQIAHYKIPFHIRFVDGFPMTVTGKIQKFVMRDAMAEELGLHAAKTA